MEHFIEGVLELLFGLIKFKPEQMPDITYRSDFTVKHYPKHILGLIVLSLVVILVFSVLAFIFSNVPMAVFFGILTFVLLLLSAYSFTYRCAVTEEKMMQRTFGLLKKTVFWKDIICVRIITKTNDSSVTIAIYNNDKKCVIDFCSPMQNFWHIVKMAEYKGIEIRKEKDLSIKELSHI